VLGDDPPAPVFTAYCQSKSPETLGVMLPAVIEVPVVPVLPLQFEVETADEVATL
jgi:hypothetical protein